MQWCCICHRQDRPFDATSANNCKVGNHDHVTGYYIGAAHDECNRNRRVDFDIPVFFHNFRGYDSNLIVTALSLPQYRSREIQVIGQNMERYMQLKWGKPRVPRLVHVPNQLARIAREITSIANFGTDCKLLLRKGVFPYEYLNSFEKFNDRALPRR